MSKEQEINKLANDLRGCHFHERGEGLLAEELYAIGYRLPPDNREAEDYICDCYGHECQQLKDFSLFPTELKVLEVPKHSESIWCPHCGGEFGIETRVEQAYQSQLEADKGGR